MKRKNLFYLHSKSLFAMILVLMILTVSACAKSDNSSDNNSTNNTTAGEKASSQAQGSQQVQEKKPLYTIQVLTNMSIDPNIKSSDENEIGKIIKEKFNIVFDYVPYTGDYLEKANILLATGDYPEMMTLSGPDIIRKYVEAGAAIDLEQYSKECPNFSTAFKTQIPFWRSFSSTKTVHHWENGVGGNMAEQTKILPSDVAIRSDALEKQNWPNVIKEDNLIAFLKQALKDFPEVDGKKTIGLTVPFGEPWGLQGIASIGYEKGEKYVATAGNNEVIWNTQDGKYEGLLPQCG